MSYNIEDSYPLSPTQQGMLFHDLAAPGAGMYFNQLVCLFEGTLNVAAFHRAWQGVVDRHPILRTAFTWKEAEVPRQVVGRKASVSLHQQDWCGLGEEERRERLERYLEEDGHEGFALGEAPLLRLALLHETKGAWRLVVSYHHLLLDGESLPLVVGEAFTLYEGLARGRTVVLPPPRPFREYITWLEGQDLRAAEAYWRQALRGFRAPTPLGLPAPAAGPEAPGHVELRLPAAVTAALRVWLEARGLTLATAIQGAWALLLSRYSGHEDVVLGNTISGRPASLAGAELMAGPFIRTLPLRVRMSPAATVGEYLAGVQARFAELAPFERSPLVKVRAWSELPAGRPLFESIVTLERHPRDAALRAALPGQMVREVRLVERTNYPIILAAAPGQELSLRLQYDGVRVGQVAAARMLGHLRRLLEQLPGAEDRRLSALSLMAEGERRELLARAGPTAGTASPGECIHRLFEAQVARAPEEAAVTFESMTFSYAELNAHANRLAHRLRRMGVGPEVRVGLCVERSAGLVAAVLGILKAGGAYVPLDPSHPQERLALMLEDAGVGVVVTQQRLLDLVAGGSSPVLCLDTERERLAEEPAGNLPGGAEPEHLAYVLYNSDSTGRPKGTLVEHRQVSRLLTAASSLQLGPGDVWTLFHSIALDLSVWELWGALLSGGRLVVVPHLVSRSPEAFCAVLVREKVTVLSQTPFAFRQLIATEEAHRNADLALRLVILGGEALEPGMLRPWLERRGDQLPRLINMYGATETAVHASCRPVLATDATRGNLIGAPLPDVALHVLDRHLQPSPVGVPGELYVGGADVTRGYLGRPELTAERFVPDPFSSTPGARLYRSGDVARRLEDGDIEYVGRTDHQVKVRGFRVELGEVEAVLARHPMVCQAAVVACEDTPGEARLVAYVAPRQGQMLDKRALRQALRRALPDPMVPATWVVLDELPLASNGRVDRKALPLPGMARPSELSHTPHPRTPTEELLAQFWSRVLKLERVDLHGDFFALGGDSILSLQVVSLARQAGLRLGPRDLLQHPTVAALARHVDASPAPAQVPQVALGSAPLTPIQRWFIEDEPAALRHYNQALLLEVRTRLEPEQLREALRWLVERHEALRLRLERRGGAWRQQLETPPAEGLVRVVDLSALAGTAQRAKLEAEAARLQAELDPCSGGGLLRAALFELDPDSPARLLLVAHHLCVDAVSWRILLEDLETAFRQLAAGETVRLPAPATSFLEWAERLAAHARSPAVQAELKWWLEKPWERAARLPRDFPDGDNLHGAARAVGVALDAADTTALLRELPRLARAQLPEVLVAALALALARWTGGRAVAVDVEDHGREPPFEGMDLSRTVGWLTTRCPMLLEMDEISPGAALRAAKQTLRQVPGRGLGYGLLRYLGAPEVASSLAALPAREVVLSYLGQATRTTSTQLTTAVESSGPAVDGRRRRSWLLEVNAVILEGRLEVEWRYGERLHRRETVETLARNFLAALQELIALTRTAPLSGLVPSDFPLAGLEWRELAGLIQRLSAPAEDVYRLSPMQEGLLFQHLDASGEGTFHVQLDCTLHGSLDGPSFRQAWKMLAERHPILRTSFHWEGLEYPVQVVHPRVLLGVTEHDWRGLPEAKRRKALEGLLETDRRASFNLARAPLMRLSLARLGETAHIFLWSHHHILLDRWSVALLLEELFALYDALSWGRAPTLPSSPPYHDHIAWLSRQGTTEAEQRWRRALQGFTTPTPFRVDRPALPDAPIAHQQVEHLLSDEATARLEAFTREHHLAASTVLQGAWALLLSRYSGEEDVVFGVTVSGRSAAQAEEDERRVGLFINTLPLRARTGAGEVLLPWLSRLQEEQLELRRFDFCTLAQVQRLAEVPPGRPLFESLLVFESFPLPTRLTSPDGGLTAEGIRLRERTSYPLVVNAVTGPRLALRFTYDARRLTLEAVTRMAGYLEALIEAMLANPTASLGELSRLTPIEPPTPRDSDAQVPGPRAAPALGPVAPRTPMEELVAGVWIEVLGVERVGARDGFFDLGGHSLLATRVLSRLRQTIGRELPVRLLFDAPTVESLAQRLEAELGGTAGGGEPISPVPRDGPLPLSFAQERLWLLDQLEPGSSAHYLPAAFRLEGPLDVRVLERAVGELVRRHESLRSTFAVDGGVPVQRIAPVPVEVPWRRVSARVPGSPEREQAVRNLVAEEASVPFDLSRGPLVRAALLELGNEEHVLLLTMHQSISDGWSAGVLVRELGIIYPALARGEPPPLPPLPVQYADFACWQRSPARAERLARQLAYWKGRLVGAPTVLELPADFVRPRLLTYRGERASLPLAVARERALRALSHEEGATPFMAMLATFAVLLGRLSGREELLIGTPATGRGRPELESLVGRVANTLVLRVDLSGDPSFRELLGRVRESCLGAWAHADVPFEQVVAALGSERDLSRAPLVQVMFQLFQAHSAPAPSEAAGPAGSLKVSAVGEGVPGAKLDLALYAHDRKDGLRLEVVYNADLFSRERAVEILQQLEHLLAQVTSAPEERMSNLSLVTPATVGLPDPKVPIEGAPVEGLLERFARHVAETPERVALSSGQETWTYGELDARSRAVAARLREANITPGDSVAIHACRDASLVAALLGVLRAGAAFFVLDPAETPTRLLQRIEAAMPRALIELDGAGPVPGELEVAASKLVLLRFHLLPPSSVEWGALARAAPSAAEVDVARGGSEFDLAYVTFTSGVAGKPKGIAGTLRPVCHFLGWYVAKFGLGAEDRFSLLAGLGQDPLLRDVFTPLWLGAELCVPPPGVVREGGGLGAWLEQERVTVAHLTPALVRSIEQPVSSLRHAFVAGDVFTGADVARLRLQAPAASCTRFYGTHETPQAMAFHVASGLEAREQVPLGRGIDGVQVLVINQVAQFAGVGELGELCIRTPYLALGYLDDDPDVRFAHNPLTWIDGDRVFRTGDMGRYLPGGEVELLCRSGEQFELHGHRITPGEIEARLCEHPAVRDAAVVPRWEGGRTHLTAYVVAGAERPGPDELRAHLEQRLPGYLVPSGFTFLAALPLTPDGRVDRRALRTPSPAGPASELTAPPRDDLEREVAALFEEALGVRPIGIADDFFERGGHSLLAVQLLASVQRRFGREVPLASLLQRPTVEHLAGLLRRW